VTDHGALVISGMQLTPEALERVKQFMEGRRRGDVHDGVLVLPEGAEVEYVPSYVLEHQIDPELVSKINVTMRLTVQLARVLANVLQAMGKGTPAMGVDQLPGRRIVPNEELREASVSGVLILGGLLEATKVLPPEWRLVQCESCRRLWLGEDVMSWWSLEARSDFEAGAPVTFCPACEPALKERLEARLKGGSR
jgi:hypothetical protein